MLRLKCYQEVPNAGDVFNLVLAERYFGKPISTFGESPLHDTNLILGGSLVHWADANSIVCGAGLLRADLQIPPRTALITSVRGPLTADALYASGHHIRPDLYGDPGILVAEIYPSHREPDIEVAVIPHYVDADNPWVNQCRDMGIRVLDVCQPLDMFLDELRQSAVVLSSSLHGIIFAHAYGRRALWVELSNLVHGDGFKFFDYYASIGVPPTRVTRHRVTAKDDPIALAENATPGQQAPLLAGVKTALSRAAERILAGV